MPLYCQPYRSTTMTKLTIDEAQARLQEILDEEAKGEEIEITKGDGTTHRVAVTVHSVTQRGERIPDLHPGSFTMSDDFNEELPDSFWLGEE